MDKDLINDLDDAIKHCEEEAKEQRWQAEVWEKNSDYQNTAAEYLACAKEHEQLAEWLKELKSFKEGQTSRKDFIEILRLAEKALDSQWIPITYRPMTEEEVKEACEKWGVQEEILDEFDKRIFTCPLPDDGQEILVSRGKYVFEDTCSWDEYDCGLENNGDWDGVDAWMPKPEPYKKEGDQ